MYMLWAPWFHSFVRVEDDISFCYLKRTWKYHSFMPSLRLHCYLLSLVFLESSKSTLSINIILEIHLEKDGLSFISFYTFYIYIFLLNWKCSFERNSIIKCVLFNFITNLVIFVVHNKIVIVVIEQFHWHIKLVLVNSIHFLILLLFQIVIKWVAHSVATPAFLCHKEPAQGTQSPLLGAFLAFRWFFMAWG